MKFQKILSQKIVKILMILIPSIFLMTGCQLTEEDQNAFDPERAALARLKLGLAYLAQADLSDDNLKAAHYNLSLANKYSPYNPNIMLGMALFDQKVGEHEEAEMIYKKITQADPNNGLFFIHYGTFLCANGRYEEAKTIFNQSIILDRKHWKSDGLEQLGYCAIQNHDIKQANNVFTILFQYDPSKKEAVHQTGELYLKEGETSIGQYLISISSK